MTKERVTGDAIVWVVGALFFAALVGCFSANVFATKTTESSKNPPALHSIEAEQKNTKKRSQESLEKLEERIVEIESSQRSLTMSWIEGQRKAIDWWLSFLGVMVAALALLGALIPYLMGLKNRDLIEATLREARNAAAEARSHQKVAEAQAKEAIEHAATAKSNAEQSEKLRRSLAGQEQSEGGKVDLEAAAKEIKRDPKAAVADKLRASAVAAGAAGDPEAAHHLWVSVLAFDPNDHVAAFNAGYWANLVQTTDASSQRYWLQQAAKRYARALELKPDMDVAANNLGLTMHREATLLSPDDLPQARLLWKKAREMYAQATKIKSGKYYEAAINWGNSFQEEAKEVVKSDLIDAQRLWKLAREKYNTALEIRPGDSDVNLNWAIGLEREALALEATDPAEATSLRRLSIERYRKAHAATPDDSQIVNNLAGILVKDYSFAINKDEDVARQRIAEAKSLLLALSGKNPGVVAYNLACCYALENNTPNAIAWLEISKHSGNLPPKEKIRDDKDFDLIKADPSFIEWLSELDS